MKEIWKDIAKYEGYYQVSNLGNVKSLVRNHRRTERILKANVKDNGYLQVHLYMNGNAKWLYVHRLVADAFLPKTDGNDIVNHIDNNPQNNNVGNLEWTTQVKNIMYASEQGRMYRQENWRNKGGGKA